VRSILPRCCSAGSSNARKTLRLQDVMPALLSAETAPAGVSRQSMRQPVTSTSAIQARPREDSVLMDLLFEMAQHGESLERTNYNAYLPAHKCASHAA